MGLVVYAFAHNIIFLYIAAVVLLFLVLLIVNVQPFKAPVAHYSKINVTFFSLLIFIYIVVCGWDVAGIKVHQFPTYVLSFFAAILFLFSTLFYWIYSHSGLGLRLASKIGSWRRGYNLMNGEESCDSMAHVRDHHSSGILATFSQ